MPPTKKSSTYFCEAKIAFALCSVRFLFRLSPASPLPLPLFYAPCLITDSVLFDYSRNIRIYVFHIDPIFIERMDNFICIRVSHTDRYTFFIVFRAIGHQSFAIWYSSSNIIYLILYPNFQARSRQFYCGYGRQTILLVFVWFSWLFSASVGRTSEIYNTYFFPRRLGACFVASTVALFIWPFRCEKLFDIRPLILKKCINIHCNKSCRKISYFPCVL